MRNEPPSSGLERIGHVVLPNSPVPQQDTYRKRSSSERLMSVTSGATALNPCSSGGRFAGSAGSAGNLDHLLDRPSRAVAALAPSRYHTQIDDDRSFSETTTPTKP